MMAFAKLFPFSWQKVTPYHLQSACVLLSSSIFIEIIHYMSAQAERVNDFKNCIFFQISNSHPPNLHQIPFFGSIPKNHWCAQT